MKNITTIINKDIKKFSLIQLIRVLNLKDGNIQNVINKLNISPNLTLACTKCDFDKIEFSQENYRITANFLCLYGTSSVLHIFYTEELIEEREDANSTLINFYNIFNQRAYQLLIDILLKNRLMLSIFEFEDEKSLDFIYGFMGLNRTNTNKIKHIKTFKLLRYIDILNNDVKSINSVETFLSDLFNITFKVKEYIKVKLNIHKEEINALGKKNSHLGTCYLGDKINNITTTLKIILQNLSNEEFNSFLPGEINFSMLIEGIELFFENNPYKYILEYSIQKEISDKNNFILGNRNYSRLGMSSCLGTRVNNYVYNGNHLLLQ